MLKRIIKNVESLNQSVNEISDEYSINYDQALELIKMSLEIEKFKEMKNQSECLKGDIKSILDDLDIKEPHDMIDDSYDDRDLVVCEDTCEDTED